MRGATAKDRFRQSRQHFLDVRGNEADRVQWFPAQICPTRGRSQRLHRWGVRGYRVLTRLMTGWRDLLDIAPWPWRTPAFLQHVRPPGG